jgi:Fic family protein
MNTYYSNLIEGHDTRPRDSERARAGELDQDEGRRNLQIEAAAHVRVQADVDQLAAEGRLPEPASAHFIRWLHREFYREAPESMLRIRGPVRDLLMTPGEWPQRPNTTSPSDATSRPPAIALTTSCATSPSVIDSNASAGPDG